MTNARPSRQAPFALDPAFTTLLRAEFGYVTRTLARLGVRMGDTEDVAQEIWLQVHAKWLERDASRPTRPWLFAFALRAAANYRRLARHRESPEGDALQERAEDGDVEGKLIDQQERTMLLQAIQALDLEHSAALVLVDIDEVSPQEAAQILGIPVNTVYSRVRNARIKVKAHLLGAQSEVAT